MPFAYLKHNGMILYCFKQKKKGNCESWALFNSIINSTFMINHALNIFVMLTHTKWILFLFLGRGFALVTFLLL